MAAAKNTETTVQMRAHYHVARARLLLDLVRHALEETEERLDGGKLATSLRVVSNELDQAASVLRGTATPANWRQCAPVVEFGEGT
jgi:predicted MarR family transcription regulator